MGRLQDTSVLLEAPITSTPPPLQTATLSLNADSLLLFKGIHPHRFTHSHSAAAKLNLIHLSSVTHISGTLLLFRCEKDESSGRRVALCQQVKRIRKFHFLFIHDDDRMTYMIVCEAQSSGFPVIPKKQTVFSVCEGLFQTC